VEECNGNDMMEGAKFCCGCGRPLGAQCMGAMGGVWHPQCFKCVHCLQPCSKNFIVREGKPYHPQCFKQTFGKKCAGCGETLEGYCVQVDGRPFHSKCFVCNRCRRPLTGGYVEVCGQSYCSEACGLNGTRA